MVIDFAYQLEKSSAGKVKIVQNYPELVWCIEHVAIGSDFDGAKMPKELKDAAGLPKLIEALRESGYDDSAIEQIAYKNWLRIIKDTWKSAG